MVPISNNFCKILIRYKCFFQFCKFWVACSMEHCIPVIAYFLCCFIRQISHVSHFEMFHTSNHFMPEAVKITKSKASQIKSTTFSEPDRSSYHSIMIPQLQELQTGQFYHKLCFRLIHSVNAPSFFVQLLGVSTQKLSCSFLDEEFSLL